jgi:hypothetical protein
VSFVTLSEKLIHTVNQQRQKGYIQLQLFGGRCCYGGKAAGADKVAAVSRAAELFYLAS